MVVKIAFITGGTRGIGKAVVKKLYNEGYHVVATYNKNKSLADTIIKELGGKRIIFFQLDLMKPEPSISHIAEYIEENYGKLDVLVNNAAVFNTKPFEKMTLEEWKLTLQVNLTGPFIVIKKLLPLLKRSGNASIINMASLAGVTGNVFASADYVASKAGLIGLTKKLAVELAVYGIRVNAIAPSLVETDLVRSLIDTDEKRERIRKLHPLGLIISPEDIAETVSFLADPSRSRAITGTVINVNAGRYT